MIRLVAVAFVLAVATSAQAMSPAPLHQPDGMTTQARVARQVPPCYYTPVRYECMAVHDAGQMASACGGTSPGPPPGPPQVLRIRLRYRTEPGGHNKGQGSNKVRPV